jgi:hypothetical protein
MTHLSRDELQRWWDEGRPEDRERVVGHLAACDECCVRYGAMMDARPADADRDAPFTGGREPLSTLGHAAWRRTNRTRPVWWPPLAAAAGIAAVLLLSIVLPGRPPAAVPDEVGIRGSTLQALTPAGAVSPPIRFGWASPVDASRYLLEVRDDAGRVVLTLPADGETVEASIADLAGLTPGDPYTWQAVALSADGDIIMRSAPQSFSIVVK